MNEQEAKAIVLEWLKRRVKEGWYPVSVLEELYSGHAPSYILEAHFYIWSTKTAYELLAEFAEWGLKEGADRV
ncbi:hypothetical protein [Listeria monocytogenes]|uniref:hypothetical protein n=1 Tax=Listeria monocytogenes TaxID=1639 RepID=UPI00148C7F54|nr:hypothetical protein [Listeria monocytogenes]EGO5453272.1 hypothetical protein [Listeria monocytogenes]EHX3186499.1 hypothetical protein [Listeria monocytogenes]QJW60487.1 hypothetical protein HNT73_10905 [Listeria monocytogenes]HAA3078593.1 hypothetical protein [Listeria monocytogenes]HAB0715344.1 hypothetical protein [Listeria monocytogenes]